MNIITEKLKSWLPVEEIEPDALQQLLRLSRLDVVPFWVGVMPDCHLGKGACVGSVIPTLGAIIPAAVGVDIGCGVIAVKTKLMRGDLKDLKSIREGIERRVPLSAGGINQKITPTAKLRIGKLEGGVDYSKFADWRGQLGSLGSGNHFIEISTDENNQIWAVLHSGSRGVGNQIAQHHIKIAQNLMDKYRIKLEDKDLAYLVEGTDEFDNYMRDLSWAQNYALANREEMMDRVMTELSYSVFGEDGHQKDLEIERINCHHNFTQMEHHMGKNLWISRKGAIQMRLGQLGVIPGSMGTRSYIVSGLENPQAFHTAPHGAGRRFSRSRAKQEFNMQQLEEVMGDIEYRHTEAFIDEIPMAYKDIDQVMEYSKDLVKIEHTLKQIINVKGD